MPSRIRRSHYIDSIVLLLTLGVVMVHRPTDLSFVGLILGCRDSHGRPKTCLDGVMAFITDDHAAMACLELEC